MPVYHSLGLLPPKRHSQFRRPDGSLYQEELIGNLGFTGLSSLLYHLEPPTQVKRVFNAQQVHWEAEAGHHFQHRHFLTTRLDGGPSPTLDRVPVLFNHDVALSVATPSQEDEFFYRNAQGDEVVYVSEGAGALESQLGEIPFRAGDYLVIPRGIVHRYRLSTPPFRLLIIESTGYVRTPKRYRNEHGQLLESAPYSERDIRRPQNLPTRDESGEFRILAKKENRLTEFVVARHPFDVAGWDGYYYPWAISIHAFEPRVGRFHLPPPFHQTFEGDGFVIGSFCPRPSDFDPQSVPAPYHHSNIMSDEVLYYADPAFTSRRGLQYGSITLHPDGLPHGPHPGRYEDSLGREKTDELFVMLDAFHPLKVSAQVTHVEDAGYYQSWLK